MQNATQVTTSPLKFEACLQLEVPELPKGLEEDILEDIRNREDVSAAKLPSAIFYTFVNTHQTLSCADFSRTGAYVAGADWHDVC